MRCSDVATNICEQTEGERVLCDAQVHIWGADTPARPWPKVHGEPHREVPYGAQEIIEEMDRAGVERAVIVPPSWEGDRNDLAVNAVTDYPGRFCIMGRVNLGPAAPRDLSHWLDTPGMRGVRLTFHRPEMRRWLTDGSASWLWEEAERLGLPVMLLAPGQSAELVPIARRYRDLTLIIDHCNLSVEAVASDIGPAIDSLMPLVDCANVIMKISALPCYTEEVFPFQGLQGDIRRVIDAFGKDRCVWGSDISRLPCDYRDWATLFLEEFGLLSHEEAEAVGGATLCRALNWS